MMDLTSRAEATMKIILAVSLSFGICCIVLCCGAYILSKKKYRKQNQIHLTNGRCHSVTSRQVFTIDVPDIPVADPYLSDEPPPMYESTQESFSRKYLFNSFDLTSKILFVLIIAYQHQSNNPDVPSSTVEHQQI